MKTYANPTAHKPFEGDETIFRYSRLMKPSASPAMCNQSSAYSSMPMIRLEDTITSKPPSAINNHPSVGMQTLPGHEAAILTRQKHKTGRNLTRLPGPAHGRSELVQSIFLHRRRDQGRPHGARTDAVDADPELELLVREPAGEGDDGAFAGGVVEEIRAADVGVHRGAVDDRVAGFHVLQGVFTDVEHGVHVRVEGADPLVSGVLLRASVKSTAVYSVWGRADFYS